MGLRAPNLRQRVFDSLDSPHAAAGLRWCVFAALMRLCAATLALLCFPRGVRWGCAPQTAPKSLRLSGLSSRCGGAVSVQIRCACASLRRRIGAAALSAGSTLGLNVEAALRPPQTAPKSLRLSGLSSGAGRVRKCVSRGGVALVRIRRACTLLRSRIGTVMLSAGSTLGATRPQTCAKESSTLWTLLALRRGRVSAYTRRRHPGTRKDLTGSDLWPVRSGCIAIISTRTIGDLPDSDLWSGRSCITARQQVEAGTAGRPQAARSRVACAKRCGKPHGGLSGLSSFDSR